MRLFGRGLVRLAGFTCVVAAACLPARIAAADTNPPNPSPSPAASPAAPASPAPTASLIPDATARLPFGASNGTAKLVLLVGGLTAATKSKSDPTNLKDVGGADTAVDKIDFKPISEGTTTRIFELDLAVKNLPRNATQTRTLSFTVAGSDKQLAYTLTNVSVTTYALSLKAPPSGIALERGAWLPVSAIVGPLALSGVKLLPTSVIEKNTRRPLTAPALQLCQDMNRNASPLPNSDPNWKPNGPCDGGKGLALAPNATSVLWIGPADSVGTYENQNITITSDQKPEGETTALSFFVSAWWLKLWGVVVIFIGVVAAWVPTVYVRGRLAREQAYLPVLAVRETIEQLQTGFATTPATFDVHKTRDRLAEQYAKLDDTQLQKNGLPALVASPFAVPGAPTVEQFRQYVQGVSDWATVLATTVSALLYIISKWSSAPDDTARATLKALIAQLDDIAGAGPLPAPPIDDVRKQVAVIRGKADQALTPLQALSLGRPPTPTERAEQQIRVDIAVIGVLSWVYIGIVTTVLGAYVLVYSPAGAGFGTVLDYLIAFFWGLGLPAASQLTTATTSTVSSAFKVTPPA